MKKYGLQLRVQSQQKKQPQRLQVTVPHGFDDEDDENVEREILRQAHKNKSHKDVEEQHKKALEEDPSAFDYDGVYDEMKEQQVRPLLQDRQDRKPRYVQALMEKAKLREREHEIIYEKKLAKERSVDDDLYADKDKFVTGAYKKKLAEQGKWMEEERLREMREEKEDVTKKTDLSDFYFNLAKNVAYGSGGANLKEPKKQPDTERVLSPERVPVQATDSSPESSKLVKIHQDDDATQNLIPKQKFEGTSAQPIADSSMQEQAATESLATEQPRSDHHKRSEDALAAAKERFLARKKAKVP